MYAENVVKVLKDVTTPQKVVRKVLRDNDMQIVSKFTPVNSEYKFNIGDKKRITMTLTEDEFVQKEEKLRRNRWETTTVTHIWDSPENLENALVKSISEIVDLGARFKRYRNIK